MQMEKQKKVKQIGKKYKSFYLSRQLFTIDAKYLHTCVCVIHAIAWDEQGTCQP